jgi:lipid A ethanolaminephosphotransferase
MQYRVVFLACAYYATVLNYAFFRRFGEIFSPASDNRVLLLSAWFVVWAVRALFFSLFASRITTRLLLLVGLLVGVPSSYFANQYGSIVDVGMIQNFLETDRSPLRHYFRSTARLNSSQEIALR